MRNDRATICWATLSSLLALTCVGCGGIVDKEARAKFYEDLGHTSITVFPAFVRDGKQRSYDQNAASAIGEFLTQEKLATVTISDAEVPITSRWGMNQARMLRDSAADFSAYVREHPLQTEYALLPEYLKGGGGPVVGVHLYLVDRAGTVAYAILQNSHHKTFKEVDPKSVADATEIVVRVLRDEFVPHD